jgi:hypothetical protein
MAINAAIYKTAGFPPGEDAELDLVNCGFTPEMLRLGLGALLRLALFVVSIRENDKLRRKQRPFTGTDLAVATEIDRGTVAVLRVTANEAGVTAHTVGGLIWDLARKGQIGAIFLNRAPGWEPHRVLDSTGIAEPMDCHSRRGTRALHAATRSGEGARSEELHSRRKSPAPGATRKDPSEISRPGVFFFFAKASSRSRTRLKNILCR